MAVEKNITRRWESGTPHHPKAEALYKRIAALDFEVGGDYFCFKSGGDGDNGEHLMYLLDIIFEQDEADRGTPQRSALGPTDSESVAKLLQEGHDEHCAARLLWGDGCCECGHTSLAARGTRRRLGMKPDRHPGCAHFTSDPAAFRDCESDGHYLCRSCNRRIETGPEDEATRWRHGERVAEPEDRPASDE